MNLKAFLPALAAVALTLAGCRSQQTQPQSTKTQNMTVIIDVRTQKEYDAGHLEGALHMPYDEIDRLLPPKIAQKDTHIQLYCRSGNRSGKALKTIQGMGYTNSENIGAMPEAAKAADRNIVK